MNYKCSNSHALPFLMRESLFFSDKSCYFTFGSNNSFSVRDELASSKLKLRMHMLNNDKIQVIQEH